MERFLFSQKPRESSYRMKCRRSKKRPCRLEVLERRLQLAGDLEVLSLSVYEQADVNGDSVLSPVDPLQIVNAINRRSETPPPPGLDINGDAVVNAADVDFFMRVFSARYARSELGSTGEGPVSSSETMSLSMVTLSAGDDSAYTQGTQVIDIDVLQNDIGDLFYFLSATDGTHGTTQFVNGMIRYTPTGALTGSDSFTYTIKDWMGVTDTATVTIDVVDMTDFTVERQKRDGSWVAVADGDVSWAHDTLRWTPIFSSTYSLTQETTWWSAVDRSDPTVGTGFAAATDPDLAIGNPGAGLWNVKAFTEFTSPKQSMIAVNLVTPKAMDFVKIESVDWLPHAAAPGESGIVAYDFPGSAIMYPDAAAPGGSARNKIDVVIEIAPKLPGVDIVLDYYDVDDTTDDDGPIDDDLGDSGDINNSDNFITGTDAQIAMPYSGATDQDGKFRGTLQINWIQPGNNFRVAAGPRQEELDPVEPKDADGIGSLFYDEDANGSYNSGDGPLMDHASWAHGVGVSPLLTIWRKLQVEVDAMGVVTGNVTAIDVDFVNRLADKCILFLVDPLAGSVNRYEGGQFESWNGSSFDVVSSSANSITVQLVDTNLDGQINGQDAQPVAGTGSLSDDDYYTDGMAMPMPNTSGLDDALAEAFVTPIVSFDNSAVAFDLNINSSQEHSAAAEWDTKAGNSTAYWVAYLLGAHQYIESEDGDPDSETPTYGTNNGGAGGGESLIYLETLRESANPVNYEIDTVVHEVGHAVGNSGAEDNPATPLVSEGPTNWPEYPPRYSEAYLLAIRSSEKPHS